MNDNSKQKDEYIKRDLRRRFDDAGGSFPLVMQINIIDEARSFGFDVLANEMINDFCHDSSDSLSLWQMHEQAGGRDLAPDEAYEFYYWQQTEQEHMWNREQENRYRLPETNYDY